MHKSRLVKPVIPDDRRSEEWKVKQKQLNYS